MVTFSPDWSRVLAGVGQGLMSAGQPGANLGNFGTGLMQGTQHYDQGVDRKRGRELEDIRLELMKQEQESQRLANTKAAEQQRLQQELLSGLGQDQMQTASGAPGQPDPRVFQAFPELGAKYLEQQMFPKAADASAPTIKDFYEGGKVIQKQWDPATKSWMKVGEGARWEPNAPAASGETWVPYVDPVSKRSGQKNTKTGKVDWDPGSTMMVQIGTDQDGKPIYDMVSTAAGKPPSEANIQAGIRGTLIETSINEIRKIASDAKASVSPLRMAAADAISERGPLGAYGANVLRTDDEKKFSASIAQGVEGLVAAITGAGVAMSQFPRIQQFIPGPTDSPEIVNWKLDQLMPILDTLVAGSGPLALSKSATPNAPENAEGWEDVDGVQIRVKP